ncbi:MAG: tRNA pseudouridine(55) synthase TruB [bacterium]
MKQPNQELDGFLIINKPKDITSFDAIRKIKKILNQKIKIGHTGTLDDFATGLLIICIGKTTKQVPALMDLNKEYIVTAKLGELTDSLDYTGNILEIQENIKISSQYINNAIQKLGNQYEQIPPIYSALKFNGKPLYKLARNKELPNEELEKITKEKTRVVKIEKIELTDFKFPFFTIKTTVSKGTYIRSLANDIAKQINLYATTYELQRTKIGNINLDQSVNLDEIKSFDDIKIHLKEIINV